MNFRNVWTNGGTYAVNDVVLSMGNLFVCVTAIAGSTTVPISDSHFMMCTNSLNQYGGWYAGINYYQNNLVTYSGVPYLCTSFVNSTTAPPSDTAHWIALGSSSSLYKSGFTNSALASGLLTVTHNLGVQYPLVEIYDNNGNLATPNKISSPNINTAIVDLTNYLTIPTASNCAWWAMDEASGTTVANGDGGSAGTASGTANIVAGMYGNARQFDGSTGFVNGSDAGFPFSTAMRSIMCWFKISALTLTTGNYWVLWGYGSNTSAGMWALVIYYTTGTGYRLGVTNGTSFWLFPWGTGDTNWHHLAVTLPNGATVIGQSLVYLDGIIQSSATGASPLAAVATNLSEFAFAVKPVAHTNFFPGIIDDVRMYPLFLSQPQVAACMMQGALQGTWDASVRS
jgi:hypothetical protein